MDAYIHTSQPSRASSVYLPLYATLGTLFPLSCLCLLRPLPLPSSLSAGIFTPVHLPQVLHVQNPGEAQSFENVALWLKETAGVTLEGVSFEDFRARLSEAVESKGPGDDVRVLAQLESGLDGFAYYLKDPARLNCSGLTAALEESGIECPSLDKKLVGVYASTLTPGRE